MSKDLEKIFPLLSQSHYRISSPQTPQYNCIAWAASDDTRWWWPFSQPFAYWPQGVPREITIEAFIQAFETLGYRCCDSRDFESGYEKIAIYVDADGKPTHAARLLKNEIWTSKLGRIEDIEHVLEGLENSPYGNVGQILKRPMPDFNAK